MLWFATVNTTFTIILVGDIITVLLTISTSLSCLRKLGIWSFHPHHTSAWCLCEPEKCWLPYNWELHMVLSLCLCWELSPSSLEEQLVLLKHWAIFPAPSSPHTFQLVVKTEHPQTHFADSITKTFGDVSCLDVRTCSLGTEPEFCLVLEEATLLVELRTCHVTQKNNWCQLTKAFLYKLPNRNIHIMTDCALRTMEPDFWISS